MTFNLRKSNRNTTCLEPVIDIKLIIKKEGRSSTWCFIELNYSYLVTLRIINNYTTCQEPQFDIKLIILKKGKIYHVELHWIELWLSCSIESNKQEHNLSGTPNWHHVDNVGNGVDLTRGVALDGNLLSCNIDDIRHWF